MIETFGERTYDRSAPVRLHSVHSRAFPPDPSKALHLVESLPHTDEAGPAARGVEDHVREAVEVANYPGGDVSVLRVTGIEAPALAAVTTEDSPVRGDWAMVVGTVDGKYSGRPGNVIDFFSRTGLYIVAIKIQRMSVAEAMEFYGPVRDILRTKMNETMGAKARTVLERELGFPIPPEAEKALGGLLGPLSGEHQFESIVKFMSGRTPSECAPSLLQEPGSEKCIALVYEGHQAIRKIRDVLGPTDPSKAPPGSIRREFGSTIMVNAAHASDSNASVQREMAIVRLGQENMFRRVIEQFYGEV